MKTTQILKQSYSVANGFDEKQCVTALQSQLSDKVFKELINGEKHSLTLTFIIEVNEEETHELDAEKLKALRIVKELQSMTSEQMRNPSMVDLVMLNISARQVDTSLLDKHKIELP